MAALGPSEQASRRNQSQETALRISIDNSGFKECLNVPDREINRVHRPLLQRFAETGGARCIIALAGPPGSGKGVLCELWSQLADKMDLSLVAVSLDGFHFPNAYLTQRGLADVKGAPETFDVRSMTIAMAQARAGTPAQWPRYDRNLHEPVPDGPEITDQNILVVEGNYLLLDEPHWASARRYADLTVRVWTDRSTLEDRIVARHMRGGMTREEAREKFAASDLKNILRVDEHSIAPDIALLRGEDGEYRLMAGGERTL